MQIPITVKNSYPYEISVVVDGVCNHAAVEYTYEEEVIHTHPDQQEAYVIIEVATCLGCGASKNVYAEDWQ